MLPQSSLNTAGEAEDHLTLRSRISDISRILGWTERLASRYEIPEAIQFAINLCLEEIVSNIIRHGYGGEPDGFVRIYFTSPQSGRFDLAVEDEAPLFDPLALPELPPPASLDDTSIGGHGIRLVRKFANTVSYEPLQGGNRMNLTFGTVGDGPKS